jgi:hypothetical protein
MKSALTKNCLESIVNLVVKKWEKMGFFRVIWGGFCYEESVQSI